MPIFAWTVPYMRTSPIQIPRRDMVLTASDSLTLSITVVDSDDPDALPIDISPGIGGQALRMTVWPATYVSRSWGYGYPALHPYADYGWGYPSSYPRTPLWAATGTVDPSTAGTFDVQMPVATMTTWPPRCFYALQLDQNGGLTSDTVAQGMLHVRRAALPPSVTTADVITTDRLDPITTD